MAGSIAHLVVLFLVLPLSSCFVPGASHVRLNPSSRVRLHGFLDNLMDFVDPPKDKKKGTDWKEEQYRAQQEMLRKRRETGGFLSEEERMEISNRRQEIKKESQALNDLQKRNADGDTLEEWKRLRAEGTIRTATSGLERDKDSSRLGSEGLFAERIDERLPYIDSGYVPEDAEESSGDFLGGLAKSIFGGDKNEGEKKA